MGIIILEIVLFVALLLLFILVKDEVLMGIFGCCIVLVLVGSIVGDINNYKTEDDINRTIELYGSLKAQVEIVNNSNYKIIRNAIIPDLIERVDSINKTIKKNKNNYDSWWVGMFYSEEIGKLEPLRIEY
jgi:hypothetical protein